MTTIGIFNKKLPNPHTHNLKKIIFLTFQRDFASDKNS